MPTVITTITDPQRCRDAEVPRSDLVVERADGPGRFVLEHGPFDRWERTIVAAQSVDGPTLTQTVQYRMAVPIWRRMFHPLVNSAIRTPPRPGSVPWWSPPDRLDAVATRSLSLLCALALVAGYLGTLLTQTNTFAKAEFGSTDGEISAMLAATRIAALLALVLVAMADRRGRRWVLIISAVAGCAITATGAITPDLVMLGISQTTARTFSTALAVVIGIYAVEEMPAGSRAFAVSVLGMTGALGAGICVMALPLADLGETAWRILYLLPLLAIPGVLRIGKVLGETRRFRVRQRGGDDASVEPEAITTVERRSGEHRRRFALLAGTALLLALFANPASQLLNEYLRTDQGFSALQITLFTILTNTPGAIGVIIGGRLADTRGRRLVGAIAVGAGVGFTVLMYLGTGWWIWLWSLLGAVIGAAALPALGVYGPELFPTSSRGSANGGINVAAVAGAVVGLLAAGQLSDAFGGLPMAMAVLSAGPALVVVLIIALYPETAQRELEELNPEDAPPPGTDTLS